MTQTPETSSSQKALASLDRSGFPFQTAVASLVAGTAGWSVARSEFPWTDRHGTDQFLDLVVTDSTHYLGIECKKSREEALTFLLPDPAAPDTEDALSLHAVQIQDSTRRMELYNSIWRLAPRSPVSEFCVATNAPSGKDSRLLERSAQMLVRGLDAFAQHRQTHFSPGPEPLHVPVLFLPLIVTNSPLFVYRYDPHTVPLGQGAFLPPASALIAVPYVRFRKAFTAEHSTGHGERTVFVVSAQSLREFLGLLAVQSDVPGIQYAQLPRQPRW